LHPRLARQRARAAHALEQVAMLTDKIPLDAEDFTNI